jgi:hypothetical protein
MSATATDRTPPTGGDGFDAAHAVSVLIPERSTAITLEPDAMRTPYADVAHVEWPRIDERARTSAMTSAGTVRR